MSAIGQFIDHWCSGAFLMCGAGLVIEAVKDSSAGEFFAGCAVFGFGLALVLA